MKFLRIPLNTSEPQAASLRALQLAFSEACNAIAPIVQQTRCWNRVALHHLVYRMLRERFPQIGSQMACNAIYSVSRTCRLVLQHPNSPWNVVKHPEAPLPLLRFLPISPVYFDRHTLSLKDGQLSMFTLDGRMRFQIDLREEDTQCFLENKLQEIVLSNTTTGFQLLFSFWSDATMETTLNSRTSSVELPEYLLVLPTDAASPPNVNSTEAPPLLQAVA